MGDNGRGSACCVRFHCCSCSKLPRPAVFLAFLVCVMELIDNQRAASDADPFDGGWAKEEDKRLGYTHKQREWIVVMGGACVSVFSKHEPEICEAVWSVTT